MQKPEQEKTCRQKYPFFHYGFMQKMSYLCILLKENNSYQLISIKWKIHV